MGNVLGDQRRNSLDDEDNPSHLPLLLPDEILERILSYVDDKTLLTSCKLTCKAWFVAVTGGNLWLLKCRMHGRTLPPLVKGYFHDYYSIYFKNPYGSNLVMNPSGEEKFNHWRIVETGGHDIIVEKPPTGCNVDDFTCAFATSYSPCVKMQAIDLIKRGCDPHLLKLLKPKITVSEWHAARFDCASEYHMRVFFGRRIASFDVANELLNNYAKIVDISQYRGILCMEGMHSHFHTATAACSQWKFRYIGITPKIERDADVEDPFLVRSRVECLHCVPLDITLKGQRFKFDLSKLHESVSENQESEILFWFDCHYHTSTVVEQWVGGTWEEAKCEFTDYPEGAAELIVRSAGCDRQFWAGHYGPKMAKACTRVSF